MPRLPTMVHQAVLDLDAEPPDVVRARTDEEQAAKRFQKLDCIRMIEDHFISQLAAIKGIHIAWKDRVPFCLFFRSYSMGHKQPRESSIPATGRAARFLNVSQPSGGRVIRELGLALQDRVMLISIANSDEFLPHRFIDAPYLNLVVHPEQWKDIVSVLIPAAQLIVVHKAGTSPGLDYELGAIREANSQDRTLIVRDRDPPTDDDLGLKALFGDIAEGHDLFYIVPSLGEEKAPLETSPDPALTGFTVLDWQYSEGVSLQYLSHQLHAEPTQRNQLPSSAMKAFEPSGDEKQRFYQLVSNLVAANPNRHFEPLPRMKAFERQADEAQHLEHGRKTYEFADKVIAAGDLLMAEELLFESLGLSYMANDLGGRACACLALGQLLLLRREMALEALIPLEYASGHFIEISSLNPEPSESAVFATHLYAAANLLCGHLEAAKRIVAVVEPFKDTNRELLHHLWEKIRSCGQDQTVAKFVDDLALQTTARPGS
jgi:hypothetical protein